VGGKRKKLYYFLTRRTKRGRGPFPFSGQRQGDIQGEALAGAVKKEDRGFSFLLKEIDPQGEKGALLRRVLQGLRGEEKGKRPSLSPSNAIGGSEK